MTWDAAWVMPIATLAGTAAGTLGAVLIGLKIVTVELKADVRALRETIVGIRDELRESRRERGELYAADDAIRERVSRVEGRLDSASSSST